MISNLLNERNLPQLKSREEMLEILYREEYGYLPPKPLKTEWEVEKNIIHNFCAGKARLDRVTITTKLLSGTFQFPIYVAIPTGGGKHPFFIHINFRDDVPDRYMPTEELIDHGFAVISFSYQDVTKDDDDFTNGLAGVLYENGKRGDTSAGKIAMWAWAAHRAMDYAHTLDILDIDRSVVCGHSRLGKTALLAGASDERFSCAFSNNSGCSGAAITRGKQGEQVSDICTIRPYWFCKNYGRYIGNVEGMPFDQHFLLASIAPRKVYVSSSEQDTWADPISEFLCCAAASKAYERLGLQSFCVDKLPKPGDRFHSKNIGYHLRKGSHYFSREDWIIFIDYFKKQSKYITGN